MTTPEIQKTRSLSPVSSLCHEVHSGCHLMFLSNFVIREIKAWTNSPDEDGLANLLMASSSCGPLDKQQQPPLFKTP